MLCCAVLCCVVLCCVVLCDVVLVGVGFFSLLPKNVAGVRTDGCKCRIFAQTEQKQNSNSNLLQFGTRDKRGVELSDDVFWNTYILTTHFSLPCQPEQKQRGGGRYCNWNCLCLCLVTTAFLGMMIYRTS